MRLTLLLTLITTLASAQPTRTTWHDYLGGADSSHYSALKQINTKNVNQLQVAWSYDTGDQTSYTFSPIVIDNIAYFAAKQGSLVAVDATTAAGVFLEAAVIAAAWEEGEDAAPAPAPAPPGAAAGPIRYFSIEF